MKDSIVADVKVKNTVNLLSLNTANQFSNEDLASDFNQFDLRDCFSDAFTHNFKPCWYYDSTKTIYKNYANK